MSARKLRHAATYQGYPCSAVEYRRTPGLQPDSGYVEVSYAVAKKIVVACKDVPWRAVGGFIMNAQMDILSWFNLRGKMTITGKPPGLPAPEDGGFNQFGHLKLQTFDAYKGGLLYSVEYRDVFIDSSGLEEVTKNLDRVKEHAHGRIRIPLTDIRRWYRNYGALFCSINKRRRNGEWDEMTLKDGVKLPWSLKEVIQYLFSQLPGSPLVVSDSEVFRNDVYDPPTDIIGRGEPVAEHIDALLSRYGFVASMLPDGDWRVDPKNSAKIGYGQVPNPNGGDPMEGGKHLHYERKTVWITDRPPAVLVTGKKRAQRITIPYVAALQDTNGRWYLLERLMERWGYSMTKLNRQIANGHEKRFFDVPGTGMLKDLRRKILMRAYTQYAPATAFKKGKATGSASTVTLESSDEFGLRDEDFERLPFLPMVECPWYKDELLNLSAKIPQDKEKKGDRTAYTLMPPIVRASRLGSMFHTSFKEVEARFKERLIEHDNEIAFLRKWENIALNEKLNATEALLKVGIVVDNTLDTNSLRVKYGALHGTSLGEILERDGDYVRTKKSYDSGQFLPVIERESIGKLWNTAEYVKAMAEKEALIKAKTEQEQAKRSIWETQMREFRKVYDKHMGLKLKFNVPHSMLGQGSFSIDERTGILTSTEQLCQVDKPFVLDGDCSVVIADGNVIVTFGYELPHNSIHAWTNFLFVAKETETDEEPSQPVFVGMCRSSPINARVESMEGRLYQLDLGTPVNLNATFSEAWEKASALLSVPKVMIGYVYEYSGLREFPLDAGVTAVHHSWSGGKANTTLAVNAPHARLPLGPGRTVFKGDTSRVRTQEQINRSMNQ